MHTDRRPRELTLFPRRPDEKLIALENQQAEKVEELKKATNFYKTAQLVQQFDRKARGIQHTLMQRGFLSVCVGSDICLVIFFLSFPVPNSGTGAKEATSPAGEEGTRHSRPAGRQASVAASGPGNRRPGTAPCPPRLAPASLCFQGASLRHCPSRDARSRRGAGDARSSGACAWSPPRASSAQWRNSSDAVTRCVCVCGVVQLAWCTPQPTTNCCGI